MFLQIQLGFYIIVSFYCQEISGQTITQSPSPVVEGSTVTLSCSHTPCGQSSTTCVYRWSTTATSKSITLVANISDNDKSFTCHVTMNGTALPSAQINLKVSWGPNKAEVSMSDLTQTENVALTSEIKCNASCNPRCAVKWTVGSTPIGSSVLFPTGTILKRGDAGTYTCNVSNSVSSRVASTIITVRFAPNDVSLTFDEDTRTLKCTATGVPDVLNFYTITQTVSGTVVRILTPAVVGNTATVDVRTRTQEYQMTGHYECTVQNGIISYIDRKINQTATCKVSIKDKPIFPPYKETYTVSKGYPIEILLQAYSYPDVVNYTVEPSNRFGGHLFNHLVDDVMFFDKNISIDGQTLRLEINKTMEDYFGTYTIAFINKEDLSAEMTIELLPEGPPDIPLKFEVSSTSHDTVTFKVESGFYNGAGQSIVLEHKETSHAIWKESLRKDFGTIKNQEYDMTSDGLSQNTEYQFRVYSMNAFNRSDYSAVVEIKTAINVGMVAGIVVGGLVAIFIIIIIIVVIVKKNRKEKKPPPPVVPFTDIFGADNLASYENTDIARDAKEPGESSTFSIGKTYENVEDMTKPAFERAFSQDSKGYIKLEDGMGQAAQNDYYNTERSLYANTSFVQNNTETPRSDIPATADRTRVDEEDYIVADKLKQGAKRKEEPAAYMNLSQQIQARLAKEKEEGMDDYMKMDLKKGKGNARESVPDFVAPLPPNTYHHQEEDYMNTSFPPVRKS